MTLKDDQNIVVSIIIPNYNHSKFLHRRLNSVINQTFKNIELIILDDASTDDSLDILKNFKKKHLGITKLITNPSNSGSPFKQWAKGISVAKGEYIWIAESDDYCSEFFLEKMLNNIKKTSSSLCYTAPEFVDDAGKKIPFQFINYVNKISNDRWTKSYSNRAEEEVLRGLGIRNTIVNVSSCLFLRQPALALLNYSDWTNMRMCGDWWFYLKLIEKSVVSFAPDCGSFFTHTPENTSAVLAKSPAYLKEHKIIIKLIEKTYPKISPDVLDLNYSFMIEHWNAVFNNQLPDFVLNDRSIRLAVFLKNQMILNDLINEQINQNEKMESIKKNYENIINDYSHQLRCLLNSNSWKITYPLRWISQKLNKGRFEK